MRAPILAKVYVHDALDLWCETGGKRRCRGQACLSRYADDCVCAFEPQAEADRFDEALGQRLGKFGLELSAEKTRVIPFSRHRPAAQTSFEFLGCEFRWGKTRAGKDHRERRPSRKQVRNSLKRVTQGCMQNRHLSRRRLCAGLHAKLRGSDTYDGVHGNFASLQQFVSSAMGILKKWLNRRRQRRSYTWAGDKELLARFRIERPRIVGRPPTSVAASKA